MSWGVEIKAERFMPTSETAHGGWRPLVSQAIRRVEQGRDSEVAQLKEHHENEEKNANNLVEWILFTIQVTKPTSWGQLQPKVKVPICSGKIGCGTPNRTCGVEYRPLVCPVYQVRRGLDLVI